MRVLQINTTVNTTSTGRIAEDIGRTLQENEHESYIAYKKAGSEGSSSHLIRIGNDLDSYLHGLKTRLTDRHGFGSKLATQKLVHTIKQINPDVIGLHNLHGYYLNIEVLFHFLKTEQKPVIWTFHDCWPFTGHCSHFEYVSCEKWKSACCECPLSNRYPASWALDNSAENFIQKKELFNGVRDLTIITPSQWLKNLVSQSFLSGYPVEVIHNGIDLERFKPVYNPYVISKYGLAGSRILLGVASVWDRIKGLNYFIELSKRLDSGIKIVLIGLPKKMIKELPENIIGIPRTENIEELVAFYSAADVFVNPTLVDNFPTTNLEALACGTPVITFRTGGSPEAVDQNTGRIVDKGNIEDLHQSILNVLESGNGDYQSNCRSRAEKYFNKNDRYQDYLKLYELKSPQPEDQ